MKLQRVNAALHLARVQTHAWETARPDAQLSFERATLWFLNQAQDELLAALREHHGLKGAGDELSTRDELDSRNLPSAAWDEMMGWQAWWPCRRALGSWPKVGGGLSLASAEDDLVRSVGGAGFEPWVDSLTALSVALSEAYAEF